MSKLSGLDLMRTLANPPVVVLTTAYSAYAVYSYKFDAVDYLLKRNQFEQFSKTTNHLLNRFRSQPLNSTAKALSSLLEAKLEVLFLESDKRIYKVDAADVHYVQKWGNYVDVFTATQGMVLTMQTLNKPEQHLLPQAFIRMHESYVVDNIIFGSSKATELA